MIPTQRPERTPTRSSYDPSSCGPDGARGTACVPLAVHADVPCPSEASVRRAWNDLSGLLQGGAREAARTGLAVSDPLYGDYFGLAEGLSCELIPEDEIRALWNETLKQSHQQVQKQICGEGSRAARENGKKLELLLLLALNSGDMELAMLLFSSLETKQSNEISKSLLQRMHDLQSQKRQYSDQIAGLDSKKPEDAKKANDLNLKIGDLGTEIGMLQTFLQEVTAHKNEAQQLASNFLKGRHEVGMSIARNVG